VAHTNLFRLIDGSLRGRNVAIVAWSFVQFITQFPAHASFS